MRFNMRQSETENAGGGDADYVYLYSSLRPSEAGAAVGTLHVRYAHVSLVELERVLVAPVASWWTCTTP